jgi:hypothetical protein
MVDILLSTFGLQNVNVQTAQPNPFDGQVPDTIVQDTPLYTSPLGTPVMSDITFKGSSYTDNAGKTVSFDDFQLDLVLINVSQTKKLTETEIQGADGETTEDEGLGPYEITINGILVADNGVSTDDQLYDLHQMLIAPVSVEVVSAYLQNLNIYNIVVKSFSFDQEAGGYSKQSFTITAKSDYPIEVQIL